MKILRSICVSAILLGLLLSSHSAVANDPGRLYRSVLLLQLSLADHGSLDSVSDQLRLRELQSEAAKGYAADVNVLKECYDRFSRLGEVDEETAFVRDSLALHLHTMLTSSDDDPVQSILAANSELERISPVKLGQHRGDLLKSLQDLDAFNRHALSIYGHHFISKQLGIADLISAVESLDVPDDENTDDVDREFLGNVNRLRQQVRSARDTFAMVSTKNVNFPLYRAELELASFEQKANYFLLPYSQNLNDAFKRNRDRQLEHLRGADGQSVDLGSRDFYAELGRWLSVMELSDQNSPLLVNARREFSRPNFYLHVTEGFANRVASQGIFRIDPVDEVILGSRVRGWSQTTGSVNFDFMDHPHNAYVVLTMNGSVVADNYSKEGPITAYTGSFGDLAAERALELNVGGVRVNDAGAYANMVSSFKGVDSIRLIEKIAYRQYLKKKADAERIASERASEKLLQQFTEQTQEALEQPLDQLDDARGRRGEWIQELNDFRREYSTLLAEDEQGKIDSDISFIDQFEMPRIFVRSSDDELQVVGTLEGQNRLASPTDPPENSFPVDFRIQVHESLLSNTMAPLFQDRVYQNWQFPKLVESFLGELPENMVVKDDKRWQIKFADGRPIQVEFEENEIGVAIYGTEFRKDQQVFRDPIKISLRLRVVEVDGVLKLVRHGKATVQFTEPGQHNAEAITFRTFLQDNLDEALKGDPMEDAIDIPQDMLPTEHVENEQAKELMMNSRLVEFRSQNGWLTIGWNYLPSTEPVVHIVDTPSIWRMPAKGTPPTPDEGDEEEEGGVEVDQ